MSEEKDNVTSLYLEKRVPLNAGFSILAKEYRKFTYLYNQLQEKVDSQTEKIFSNRSKSESTEDEIELLKERNSKLEESLSQHKKLNEFLIDQINEIKDEECRANLLDGYEEDKEEVENVDLVDSLDFNEKEEEEEDGNESEEGICFKNSVFNDVGLMKKIEYVFLGRHPPSFSTLNSYLRSFIVKDSWIFEETKTIDDLKEKLDRVERENKKSIEVDLTVTSIKELNDRPENLEDLNYCNTCREIYSVDTYPCEKANPGELAQYYIDIPDIVEHGSQDDLPMTPYISELTKLKRKLKQKKRELSEVNTTLYNLNETARFFHTRCSYFAHLDTVRRICFHPKKNVHLLFSASDDGTMKMWSSYRVHLDNDRSYTYEPLYTFRGHTGHVLDMLCTRDDFLFSCGAGDYSIRIWEVPKEYQKYERSTKLRTLEFFQKACLRGHTDVVWSIDQIGGRDRPLISASADQTVKVWNWSNIIEGKEEEEYDDEGGKSNGLIHSFDCIFGDLRRTPTCVKVKPYQINHALVGFTDGHVAVYDLEKQKLLNSFQANEPKEMFLIDESYDEEEDEEYEKKEKTPLKSYMSNPLIHDILPLRNGDFKDVFLTAHEDGQIKMFNMNSFECLNENHPMSHLESSPKNSAVTSLSESLHRPVFASASRNCYIKQWDLKKMKVIQRFEEGRNKGLEGLCSVAYHPTLDWVMAAGGANATVKLLVSNTAPTEYSPEEKEDELTWKNDKYEKSSSKKKKKKKRKHKHRRHKHKH